MYVSLFEEFSIFLLIINDAVVASKMCAKSTLVGEFYWHDGLKSPEIFHNLGINRKLSM